MATKKMKIRSAVAMYAKKSHAKDEAQSAHTGAPVMIWTCKGCVMAYGRDQCIKNKRG